MRGDPGSRKSCPLSRHMQPPPPPPVRPCASLLLPGPQSWLTNGGQACSECRCEESQTSTAARLRLLNVSSHPRRPRTHRPSASMTESLDLTSNPGREPATKCGGGRTPRDTHQRITAVGLRVHAAAPRQDQEALLCTGDLRDPQAGEACALDGADDVGVVFPPYQAPSDDLL